MVIVVTHHNGSSSASSGGSSGAAGTASIVNWFADASGTACAPLGAEALQSAEALTSVTAAIECHDTGGIVAIYARLAATADGTADFTQLNASHPEAKTLSWSSSTTTSGQVSAFRSLRAKEPALVWDYSGQPFIGEAFGPTRAALDSWWVAVGRVRR